MKGRTVLCAGCGYPASRGRLPILWPSNVNGRQAYCSVECLETVAGQQLPAQLRSRLLAGQTKEGVETHV